MLDTQMRERCLRFSSVSALNICFFQTQGVASLFQGKRLESDSFFAPDTSENVTIGGALVAPLVRLTNGMLGYIFHYPEVSVLYRRPEAVEKGLILLSATSAHAFLYDTRAERSVVIPMSNVAVMTRNANRLESYLKKVEDPRGRGGITPPGPGIDYSLKLDNALKKLEAIARAIGSLRNGPLVVKQPNDMEPAVKVLLDEGAALRRDLNRLTNEIERHFSEPDRREWTIDLNVESKGLEDAIKQLEDGLQDFSNIISASKEDGGTRLDTLALAINRGADAIVRMSVALDVYLGERREVNDGRFRPLFGYDDIFPVDCELRRSEAVFLFAHDKAVLSGGVNGSRGMVDAALEDVERLSKELRKRITPKIGP